WYLGAGWYPPEPDRRWTEGTEAVLRVQLRPGSAYRLVAEVAPYPLLPRAQRITVLYRGASIARWDLPGGHWREEVAGVPMELPTGGIDEVSFRFAVVARPSEMQVGSADRRRLAAMFRVIRFEEQAPALH